MPPKLPSKAHPDDVRFASEAKLLDLLCHYLKSYTPQAKLISQEYWERVWKMVNWWRIVNTDGIVEEGALNAVFGEMLTEGVFA